VRLDVLGVPGAVAEPLLRHTLHQLRHAGGRRGEV
jgi:hypothetical protein